MSEIFPGASLSMPPDAKFYDVEVENPAIRTEFEGGYVASRTRHRRSRLRRTFTTGYNNLDDLDRVVLEDFWNLVKGGSVIFSWFDEIAYEARYWRIKNDPTYPGYNPALVKSSLDPAPFTFRVRFLDKLSFRRSGHGHNIRFEIPSIKLEEV